MFVQLLNCCNSINITGIVELFFSREGKIPHWTFWFHYFHNKTTPIFHFRLLLMLSFLVKIYCMKNKMFFFPPIASLFLLKKAAHMYLWIRKWIPLIFMVVLDLIFLIDYLWALLLIKPNNKNVWRGWAWKQVWIRPKIIGSSVRMNAWPWMLNFLQRFRFTMDNLLWKM